MPESQATEEHLANMRYLKRWLPVMGILLIVLGVFISAFLIPDVIETVSGPQNLTLAQAAEVANSDRTYARIEAGAWDCETLRHVPGIAASSVQYGRLRVETRYSEVFFTDKARDIVMFVTLSGEVTCNDLSTQMPTGYLYAMHSDTQQQLTNDARLARYFTTDSFLEFCAYCGQDNSMIGAIFGFIFLLSGLAMSVIGRKLP